MIAEVESLSSIKFMNMGAHQVQEAVLAACWVRFSNRFAKAGSTKNSPNKIVLIAVNKVNASLVKAMVPRMLSKCEKKYLSIPALFIF